MSLAGETKDLRSTQETIERHHRRNLCRQEDKLYDAYIQNLRQKGEKPISGKGLRFAKAFFQEISKIISDSQKIVQQNAALKAVMTTGVMITASETVLNTLFKMDDSVKSTLRKGGILAGLYVGYRQYQAVSPKIYNATVLLYIFDHLEGKSIEEKFQNILRPILFRFERNIAILTEKSVEKFARYFAKNICYNLNHQKINLIDKDPVNHFVLNAAFYFDRNDAQSHLFKKPSRSSHSVAKTPTVTKTLKWTRSAVKERGSNDPTILGIVANSPCVDSFGQILVSVQKMEKTEESKQNGVLFKYPLELYIPTLEAERTGRAVFDFFPHTRGKVMGSAERIDTKKLLQWLSTNCVPVNKGQSLEDYQETLIKELQPK